MSHLTPQQFVEALEETPSASVVGHLADCESCRGEVAALGVVLDETRSVAVPEPSPLFWAHLSRRVQLATADQALPTAQPWWRAFLQPVLAVAMVAVAVTLALVVRTAPPVATHMNVTGAVSDTASLTPGTEPSRDKDWELLGDVASSLPASAVQQIAQPTHDGTTAAIDQLNPEQRAEFLRLMRAQLGGAE
jgi:hypothetical protein